METIESKSDILIGKDASDHQEDGLSVNKSSPEATEVDALVAKYLDLDDCLVYQMETSSAFNVLKIKRDLISGLVNFKRMNDHRFVNKLLEAVNTKMKSGGIYICCVETKECRKERILKKYNKLISWPYYCLDFGVKRVIPKVPYIKSLYFSLTKGLNRVISLPESLGRISSCGFKILEVREIDYITWFVLQKQDIPQYDLSPTYGALVKLNRIGKDGKKFKVYKLRTMHPYSEYIQEYVFEKNNLKEGGKLQDDFRVTNWGRIFRKLWIDELPMLINWVRGQMKLVGVRPLSEHYFNLYPENMRELRTRFKPGLVPPFYADLPVTFDEIVESERIYLEAYEKAPIRTDIRYFFRAMYNIFIKRARSS